MSANPHDEVRGLRAAARLAGRSPSGLQKLVDNGDLPATKVDGTYVFATADLEALRSGPSAARDDESTATPSTNEALCQPPEPAVQEESSPAAAAPAPETTGAVTAEAFELFEDGKSPAQVVIEMKISPEVVERLYESWLRLRATDTTSAGARSRIDDVNGSLDGLRIQMARLWGDRGNEIRRLADDLRGMEARLEAVASHEELAEVRESSNGVLGNVLAMSARLVNAERALGWCVQMVQAMSGRRYG